jgi:peptidoglycan/LPS O-acetylase OafA/YrhL
MGARLAHLDVLRAVAVLAVLASHMFVVPRDMNWAVVATADFFKAHGGLGVDLFFVLSGFLVSGLLFREAHAHGSVDTKRFLIRRGLKIYPAFYVFLVITVLLRVNRGSVFSAAELLGEGLFLQNYAPSVWTHTWSLAVEEHFYLLLVGLVFLLMRIRPAAPFASLGTIFAAVAGVVIALRIATFKLVVPFANKTHAFPTHLRLDALLFGVLLAHYYYSRPGFGAFFARHRWAIGAASVVVLVASQSIPGDLWRYALGFSLVYVGFGGIVMIAVTTPPAAWRPIAVTVGAVAAIGSFSYSIYLWHTAVKVFGALLLDKVAGPNVSYSFRCAYYLTSSLIVGVVMAKAVEFPVLRLRDRWFPSKSVGLRTEPWTGAPEPSSADLYRRVGDGGSR